MKLVRATALFALFSCLGSAPSSAAAPTAPPAAGVLGYYQYPNVHGDTVVFTSEGDLWTAPLAGGLAHRLTRSSGEETYPRFSPDGKWIAFSADYDGGGADVYVMPAEGGEPKRLTYHPAAELVVGWTPDSSAVVFRSQRDHFWGDFQDFTVPVGGGAATRLPMAVASTCAIAPDGHTIAFDRFAIELRHWKRYTGGWAQDLYVGDLKTKEFKQLTTWVGADTAPMWHRDRLFFLSDRSGFMDLWSVKPDGTDLKQHTHFTDYDARFPTISGDTIVFQHGADLWSYDVGTDQAKAIDIRLASDRLYAHERYVDPMDHLTAWDIADGKRLFVEARGQVASFPLKPGRRIDLTQPDGGRRRGVAASPDGKSVAFWNDQGGDTEVLQIVPADGGAPATYEPTRSGWHFPAVWSPKSDALAYGDQTDALTIFEPATGKKVQVDQDPLSEITEYHFSPDGRWLAYVRSADNQNTVVWLYDRQTQSHTAVTPTDDSAHSIAWDPDGKYLYFAADRAWNPFVTGYPELQAYSDAIGLPYLVILKAGDPSPLLDEDPALKKPDDDAKPAAKKDDGKKKDDKKKPAKKDDAAADDDDAKKDVTVTIDLAGLQDRTVALPVKPANIGAILAGKGRVFYETADNVGLNDVPTFGTDETPRNELRVFEFDKKKDETAVPALNEAELSADGSKLAYRVVKSFRIVDAAAAPGADDPDTHVATSDWQISLSPAEDWSQMYEEAWRLERDFYFAPNFSHIDWKAIRAKYQPFVARLGSRAELNDLIGETIAEMSTSHAYIFGGDLPRPPSVDVGMLGADLAPDAASGYIRVAHILHGHNWDKDLVSPLTESHVGMKDGDYIFAVDGQRTHANEDPLASLVGKADADVVLTVGSTPDPTKARQVLVHTRASDAPLRYLEWVDKNRAYVTAKTNGDVGYLHLRDMEGDGLVDFMSYWYPQINDKGFIIDVRSNHGGFVSDLIIERLTRALWSFNQPRNQKASRNAFRAFKGQLVFLIDQETGSDGEVFAETVKRLKLGTVIGMRTWGGAVGIRGDKKLVDDAIVTQPEFAFFGLDRKWLIENRGVEPDVTVDWDPTSAAAGRDPQLDKAIEIVQQQIKANPVALPATPDYPDKSLEGWRKANPMPLVP